MNQENESLQVERISKRFFGIQALDDVSLVLKTGKITALIGENGAGKSTLVKILAGYQKPDAGKIILNGKKVEIESVTHAQNLGISVIHQIPSFAPDLSVVDNLFLGREISVGSAPPAISPVRREAEIKMAGPFIEQYSGGFSVTAKMKELKAYQQRLVGIIKALIFSSRFLIMDEPTAALPMEEREILLSKIIQMKEEGYSILYVSHHLDEIEKISDEVVALRDGKLSGYSDKVPSQSEMIEMMTGNKLSEISDLYDKDVLPKENNNHHESVKIEDLHSFTFEPPFETETNYIVGEAFNLKFKKGSIISLSGLVGSGTKEIAEAMFGIYPDWTVFYSQNKKRSLIKNPKTAIRNNIGYLSDDRIGEAAIPDFSVKKNMTIPRLEKISTPYGHIHHRKEIKIVNELCKSFTVKMSSAEQPVTDLSGGNQQKVMLARWLFSEVNFLILNEPTQGIDVLAKQEVVKLLLDFAASGGTCLIATNDPEEFLQISDRVIVMRKGRITDDFTGHEISNEKIKRAMLIHQ